uniref:Cadherin cytoplasmic C-terminal domain-containing protein n=1 Tax=Anabas testudineus TaxID=64144 RepID=A0A7N6AI40_ANATE
MRTTTVPRFSLPILSTAPLTVRTSPILLKRDTFFSDLNLYLLIAIVSVSLIFLLSLITLIAVKCHRTDGTFSRYSAPMITTHPDGSWSYSKATQQYDVFCMCLDLSFFESYFVCYILKNYGIIRKINIK